MTHPTEPRYTPARTLAHAVIGTLLLVGLFAGPPALKPAVLLTLVFGGYLLYGRR